MVNYSYIENLMTNLILKLKFDGYICKNYFSFIIINRWDLIFCFYYLLYDYQKKKKNLLLTLLTNVKFVNFNKEKKKVWGFELTLQHKKMKFLQ